MGNPNRLYGLARQVLDTVAAGLEAANQPAPARQYVADGNLVAWDCEQLVVAVEQTLGHQGNVSAESLDPGLAFAMAPRAAVMGIWLVRCCPTVNDEGKPPAAERVDESAQLVLRDPQIMLETLWRAHAAGDLGDCQGLVFQRWQAVGPEGGLTGGVLRLSINLV